MARLWITAALAVLATGAQAAEPSSHMKALAAGWTAGFVCSDTFNAGLDEATIRADSLTGIYREIEGLVREQPLVIDRERRTVSVSFDATLPPRIAVWRPLLGCAQLPIGADASAAANVPRLTPDFKTPNLAEVDTQPWPLGDAKAMGKLPRAIAKALDAEIARAFDGASFGKGSRTTAVIVIKDGRIIAERYRAPYDLHTPQRTFSVAKSLDATIAGRAVMLGKVDVMAPANIPEWQQAGDPRRAITLDQLLRMNSGIWTNGPGNRTDEVYLGGASVTAWSTAQPIEAAPGSRYNYSNIDMMLAAYAVANSVGDGALGFLFTEVLWPLGMTRTWPETDWQGHFILSSQVWMTARDMARLALLYANDGVAGGSRLLPEGWVKYVGTPSGAQPDPGGKGTGYGAGFWLLGANQGLPPGTLQMNGNRGQYAMIVPGGVIVVRRGVDGPDGAFDPAAFTKAVLAGLARR